MIFGIVKFNKRFGVFECPLFAEPAIGVCPCNATKSEPLDYKELLHNSHIILVITSLAQSAVM